MNDSNYAAGALALVGSGEYTPAMHDTDRLLLDTLGGPAAARVVVIPTASGLEPGMPQRWNAMGVEHFSALGATVTPVELVGRDDAHDEAVLAILRAANFFYFSGGNPEYVVETLRGTPAWQAITGGLARGAVLAGCSAGAMMMGSYTLRIRSIMNGQPPQWVQAFGVVPGLVIMPHFDRVAHFVGQELFRAIIASAPEKTVLVGVDEDTALVRESPDAAWRVSGRQTVSVFDTDGARTMYQAGAAVLLDM